MPASATHAVACRRMTGTPERRSRVPCRPAPLAEELAGPARALVRSWAPGQQVHGESPRLVGWVDNTIEHVFGCRERCRRQCRGAVDAGCLDPMLDRLLAVEVAGLPDSALAAGLVGLRVAVSRLEAEFARRLVVFDRRGAAGVTGAVSTAAWLRQAAVDTA